MWQRRGFPRDGVTRRGQCWGLRPTPGSVSFSAARGRDLWNRHRGGEATPAEGALVPPGGRQESAPYRSPPPGPGHRGPPGLPSHGHGGLRRGQEGTGAAEGARGDVAARPHRQERLEAEPAWPREEPPHSVSGLWGPSCQITTVLFEAAWCVALGYGGRRKPMHLWEGSIGGAPRSHRGRRHTQPSLHPPPRPTSLCIHQMGQTGPAEAVGLAGLCARSLRWGRGSRASPPGVRALGTEGRLARGRDELRAQWQETRRPQGWTVEK